MRREPPDTSQAEKFSTLVREIRASFRAWASGDEGEATGDGDRCEDARCDDARWDDARWDDGRFQELALRCFRLQYRENAPYRRYCRRRGATAGSVDHWREVPPVPTAGFRAVPLVVGGREAAELEFRTSGTTSGRERGRHYVRDPDLYRESLEPTFRHFVLDGAAPGFARQGDGPGEGGQRLQTPVRMLSLIPSYPDSSRSSLAWMVDRVMERFGAPASARAARHDTMDWEAAEGAARDAVAADEPLCVLTTTLGAAEWMEQLESRRLRLLLPAGSVMMDTGGAKGRPGLEREEVLRRVEERLGVPAGRVVNEFGMTELLSQRYGAGGGGGARWLRGPPWLRSRAVDPVTLEAMPEGEVGLLCHFDLANAGSVCAVLTEDMGRVRGDELSYEGRAGGAPPRGCSLATSELLAAQHERNRE